MPKRLVTPSSAMSGPLSRIQRDVGVTFIHVTHDQEEAMSMADRIAVMSEGRVLASDLPHTFVVAKEADHAP